MSCGLGGKKNDDNLEYDYYEDVSDKFPKDLEKIFLATP